MKEFFFKNNFSRADMISYGLFALFFGIGDKLLCVLFFVVLLITSFISMAFNDKQYD